MSGPPSFSWKRGWRWIGACAFAAILPLATLPADAETLPEETNLYPVAKEVGESNSNLPRDVESSEGKLTLFADYTAADKTGIPLYLINRTESPITINTQDGDLFIKLEYLQDEGVWERAQPHRSTFCGNSYYSVVLPPGRYYAVRGYTPGHGTRAKVRYASYGNRAVVSNAGEGFVAPEDLEKAMMDSLATREIPGNITALLMQGAGYEELPRSLAKQVAALRLLQSYGDNQKLKDGARQLEERCISAADKEPYAARAAAAIHAILAGPWPKVRSRDALLQRCLQALDAQGANVSKEFGAPENEPALVWRVLSELAKEEFAAGRTLEPADPSRWMPVMAKLSTGMKSEGFEGGFAIASFLEMSELVDTTLPDSTFVETLQEAGPELQKMCADVLARRKSWDRLVETGWKLRSDAQLIVLWTLANPPAREPGKRSHRDPVTKNEVDFWSHCMKTQTIEAASTLQGDPDAETSETFAEILRAPLRSFLLNAATLSDRQGRDFHLAGQGLKVCSAVKMLASWNLAEDDEVLQRLLSFRGYEQREGSTSESVIHHFVVRHMARIILLKRNAEVPLNLVLKQEVPGSFRR